MSLSRRQIAFYAAGKLQHGLSVKELAGQIAAYLYETKKTHEIELLLRDIESVLLGEYGIASVKATSTHPLASEQRAEIEQLVKKSEGAKKVNLEEAIDESIVGGVIIETPSSRLDASISRKLQQLKALNSN